MSNEKICPLLSMNSSGIVKCQEEKCAFFGIMYCSIYELNEKIDELKTTIENS